MMETVDFFVRRAGEEVELCWAVLSGLHCLETRWGRH